MKKPNDTRRKIAKFAIAGAVVGLVYGNLEYLIDSQTEDVEQYFPLQLRAMSVGLMVGAIGMMVELRLRETFRKRPFLYLVLVRAIVYTAIISVCLFIVNTLWFRINEGQVLEQFYNYVGDRMYIINLLSIFVALLVIGSIDQINSLHRKGELWNFILGRFHKPSQEERIFCFIDLKGSTTLTERLGDFDYARFLKDYYADISDAIRITKAGIYQYVGDEIVLTWSIHSGVKEQNCVRCVFEMERILESKSEHYIQRYGERPKFRAGIHSGKCVVTWVGEVKREIVYIGDVLNTTARIQELCKHYRKDVLLSDKLLSQLEHQDEIISEFVDEIIPRGKATPVRIYSVRFNGD